MKKLDVYYAEDLGTVYVVDGKVDIFIDANDDCDARYLLDLLKDLGIVVKKHSIYSFKETPKGLHKGIEEAGYDFAYEEE